MSDPDFLRSLRVPADVKVAEDVRSVDVTLHYIYLTHRRMALARDSKQSGDICCES